VILPACRRLRNTALVKAIVAQPLVSYLAGTAAVAVTVRQSLLGVPQAFPGGAAIGEVVYDAGLATFAAWIFNLLVVAIPRVRDQELVLAQVSRHLQGISGAARSMLYKVREAKGEPSPELLTEPWTRDKIAAACAAVETRSHPPAMVVQEHGRLRPATWTEALTSEARRIRSFHDRVEPVYVYLPAGLVALLGQLASCNFVLFVEVFASTPFVNKDLGVLADDLYEYGLLCDELAETFLTDFYL
jgi:hypothetical protein